SNISCVISMHSNHVGRLGAYVQKLADKGMFALATANSSKHGHMVTPWGGMEGRLATNPIAYAVPAKDRLPIVMDMSTSMIAEGKIRILMQQSKPLPEGCVLDAQGNPTTDPKAFYGPPKGTILPFGYNLGYKGFGLSLLVEILSSTLAGIPVTPDGQKDEYINGICIIAINLDAFTAEEHFKTITNDLCKYVTSSPAAPGNNEVLMPGTLDFRMREKRLNEGIPVPEETWKQIVETAKRVGLSINEIQ
ncbi:MAG: Ldh family oxidoreductase, partial [Clostridiales bacterium]|nr:Ldh family oxidoreductase [Clostridiales bacterium]